MSQKTDGAWPKPSDPETLWAKVLLLHGPVPYKGWSRVRNADGKVSYARPRGKAARAFEGAVVQTLTNVCHEEIGIGRGWTKRHSHRVALMWKNMFNIWLFNQEDHSA